jgi:hypothetical protein
MIPSYIHISGFKLQTKTDNSQGTNDHDIKDAWVYIDGKLIGVFELPATIPILQEGKKSIVVFGGIKKNGSVGDRVIYPFYQGFSDTVSLIPEKIDTITPIINYKQGAKFSWLEDFEDQSISMESFGTGTTVDTLLITTNPTEVYKYDGGASRFSGLVDFRNSPGIFFHANISPIEIPRNTNVYLEVNYKSDVSVQFGFLAVSGFAEEVPVLLAFQTANWKKVYISLTEDINVAQYRNAKIKIFVKATSATAAGNVRIFFDNFKLVHF